MTPKTDPENNGYLLYALWSGYAFNPLGQMYYWSIVSAYNEHGTPMLNYLSVSSLKISIIRYDGYGYVDPSSYMPNYNHETPVKQDINSLGYGNSMMTTQGQGTGDFQRWISITFNNGTPNLQEIKYIIYGIFNIQKTGHSSRDYQLYLPVYLPYD